MRRIGQRGRSDSAPDRKSDSDAIAHSVRISEDKSGSMLSNVANPCPQSGGIPPHKPPEPHRVTNVGRATIHGHAPRERRSGGSERQRSAELIAVTSPGGDGRTEHASTQRTGHGRQSTVGEAWT